jgi:methionyl-tRNA formyltransferase
MKMKKPKFVFFGTPDIAVEALNEMETFGFLPALIVCNPDAPVGRKHIITPPPTKIWAEARNIPVFQPSSLKHQPDLTPLTAEHFDFFVVFAYGKIMPEWLISLPVYGTINAHPSLLPKLRGASPIRSTLLNDLDAAGVTIIQMDAALDHGPILWQTPIPLTTPIPGRTLDTIAGKMCGDLLVHVMQELPKGTISPCNQTHELATFCTKITKDMAELDINPYKLPTEDEALSLYKKICAFDGWPGSFFFHNGKRIKITDAHYDQKNKILTITKIIPEGKKETTWNQYFST